MKARQGPVFAGWPRARAFLAHLLCLLLLGLPALPGRAAAPPEGESARATAAICDIVAREAAQESGVPLDVLRAITRTETGRKLEGAFLPWPWTINMEGKGLWFDSPSEALAYARARHAEGARSFDMGCFQVNFRWHGEHFASLDEMMDPLANARYAARFLSELYAESGDWVTAASHYHSRTPEFASRYGARFARLRASLPPMPEGTGFAALPRRASEVPATVAMVALPYTPGAVSLVLPAASGGLLTPARPLFD
ncbi:lytic transglycosylase domain-containing protein (plasmid) [Paroceanicella profunda]|uniref:Lytic transglycosylase domain-containing protein n=1 Tax=Paroceanicella profunda TaxID=2579971 RepID=A0A5B8FJD9_9RHOB|nr:lytic transglycosylase domain-containing protein [Paroceanicella profunda]QDL94781.1 lytic transglycosylase domain-containing protein [Paroceanicella profunda]